MNRPLEHILVATDFSNASVAAVGYAAKVARSLGARLHLVHVLEEPFTTSGPYEWHLPDTATRRELRYHQALTRLWQDAEAVGHLVTASVEVRGGSVTRELAQAAIDYGAHLIVLGTRGHAGLRHLFDGDRAQRLQRITGRPILTVCDQANVQPVSARPATAA
jgi:nucleotide-binding universal stress UspA family protein